jgi:hypothetical protein
MRPSPIGRTRRRCRRRRRCSRLDIDVLGGVGGHDVGRTSGGGNRADHLTADTVAGRGLCDLIELAGNFGTVFELVVAAVPRGVLADYRIHEIERFGFARLDVDVRRLIGGIDGRVAGRNDSEHLAAYAVAGSRCG